MSQARLLVEVTASVLPPEIDFTDQEGPWQRSRPEKEHTRVFVITSEEWAAAGEADRQGELLAEVNGKATGYAQLLMLQPDRFNHVRVDWLWL